MDGHPLRITRYTFGEWVSLSKTRSGAAAYRQGSKYWLLGPERVELKSEDVTSIGEALRRGPFERADFGDRERLAWAYGACAIPHDVQLTHWDERFVLWLDGAALGMADATRPETVQLALPIELEKVKSAVMLEGMLYLETPRSLVEIARADLEGLFDRPTGSHAVHLREHYPLRRPDAKLTMHVTWSWGDTIRLEYPSGGWSSLSIPVVPGLSRGDVVTLYDLLAADQYLEFAVEGGPRRPLYTHDFPPEHAGVFELRVEPAVDPAGTLVRASSAARVEDLDRVFGMLADDPGDEASRMVIVDLLEDAGEPYAPLFGRLLGGDEGPRSEALGTLASYLDQVEWVGNLPRAATLAATAPADDDIGDLVFGDHRLGFFHTLWLGEGNFRLYARLVGAPRAVGLRHCDGSRLQTLKALIAAHRTGLRRLSNVKFVTREVIEALADPTFDRVTELDTEVQANVVSRLLDYVSRDEAKFFARAPRHLTLLERTGDVDALAAPVVAAWSKLPLHRLTIGGITLTRDGVAYARPTASEAMRAVIAAKLRIELEA